MKFYTNIQRHKNDILIREIINGVRVERKEKFTPSLYREIRGNSNCGMKTIFDKPVDKITFETMSEASKFAEKNYLHGNQNYVAQFIAENYAGEIQYDDDKIRTHYIDIEVDADEFPEPKDAKFEVSAITLYDNILNTFYVWGQNPTLKFDKSKIKNEDLKKIKIDYQECSDEVHLLKSFMKFIIGKYSPDIITGWNSDGFDVPYLINRITNIFGLEVAKKLSPWNLVSEKKIMTKFGEEETYDIKGISQLDYLKLFKKFGYTYGTQTSYKLGDIGEVILGKTKIEFEGSLHDLYSSDFQTYVEYNIMDVLLLVEIEKKCGLLKLATSMAYTAGVNYNDVFGTVGIWDSFIHKYLIEKNIVVPPKTNNEAAEYEGGYVKEVAAGVYDWVCSFDINSLYPTIIVQWNMSPETYVECPNLKTPEKYSKSATGVYFDNSKVGFIPEIVAMLYDKRVEYKSVAKDWKIKSQSEKSYEAEKNIAIFSNKEKAMKIFLNSLYGAMANRFFRYFQIEIAESITLTGQHVIKKVADDVNGYLYKLTNDKKDYVIASDTDSVVGDTLVYVNGKQTKISDLYDSISDYVRHDVYKQNFVKPTIDMITKAFDTSNQSIVNAPIKYVMKHRVKKEMFRITVDGKSVDVTSDHSVIVDRNGIFLSVSPKNILGSDKIIHI